MVRSYKFAIVRLAPGGVRDERINVGVVVFGEASIDVRLPKRLDKIRVLSSAIDQSSIRELTEAVVARDIDIRNAGIFDPEARNTAIGRVGPLALSQLGAFTSASKREYEDRLTAILDNIVNPETAQTIPRKKKSKVLTQLKRALREERVLAKPEENLSSHRVLQNFPLSEGLVADLVLKNGRMHVFETVDISSDQVTMRKAISDIAVSALVIEQAKMNFGDRQTNARLIYEASSNVESAARSCLETAAHQGAELINWASNSDKIKLITSIASLATPIEKSRDRNRRPHEDTPRLKLA
jgi:hypothetical protein